MFVEDQTNATTFPNTCCTRFKHDCAIKSFKPLSAHILFGFRYIILWYTHRRRYDNYQWGAQYINIHRVTKFTEKLIEKFAQKPRQFQLLFKKYFFLALDNL